MAAVQAAGGHRRVKQGSGRVMCAETTLAARSGATEAGRTLHQGWGETVRPDLE